jgi:hypothetical protein
MTSGPPSTGKATPAMKFAIFAHKGHMRVALG